MDASLYFTGCKSKEPISGSGREAQMSPIIRWPLLIACSALWVCSTAGLGGHALAQTSAEAPVENKSLRELRRDMRRAQDRFIDLYNELNPDRDQQIVCNTSAATGTRLTRPNCMTRAQQDAMAREAVDYLAASELAASVDSGLSGGTAEAGPLGQALQASTPNPETPRRYMTGDAASTVGGSVSYSTNMERLLSEHPELRQAYEEYVEARRRLEAAQRR